VAFEVFESVKGYESYGPGIKVETSADVVDALVWLKAIKPELLDRFLMEYAKALVTGQQTVVEPNPPKTKGINWDRFNKALDFLFPNYEDAQEALDEDEDEEEEEEEDDEDEDYEEEDDEEEIEESEESKESSDLPVSVGFYGYAVTPSGVKTYSSFEEAVKDVSKTILNTFKAFTNKLQ
jgi:hypothetical protein